MANRTWNCLALLMALIASVGSAYLSVSFTVGSTHVGMGLKACPLCFYERTFVLGVLGVLLMGLLIARQRGPALSLIALPLAVGGLGVAIFHVALELTGKLECPKGILDLGTAPKQSLAAFIILTLLLVLDVVLQGPKATDPPRGGGAIFGLILAALLGAVFTLTCIHTTPPLPDPPTKAYDPDKEPLKGCRPPFKAE